MRDVHERVVVTMTVPSGSGSTSRKVFLSEMGSRMDSDRPRIVLDCSRLSDFDHDDLHLLLCCLEEAMKRNGDVRLAGLQQRAKECIETTGLDTVFEVFETIEQADASYGFRRAARMPAAVAKITEYEVQVNAL